MRIQVHPRLAPHDPPDRLSARLHKGAYYEMFLTKDGRPIAACGIFGVTGRTSTVRMNLPRGVRDYDGWIVTREHPGSHAHPVVLTT